MLTNLSLFSGVGGLDLSARWTGKIRTVAYCESDPYAQAVLMSRMRDGSLDAAPIFEDVRTFRGSSLRGSIDIVSGGFPCQDLSIAGKRAGIEAGARSGLWKEFARIIRDVAPRFALVENVPGLLIGRGMGLVLGELAEMGFDAQWEVLSAAAVGAPHLRERVWIVAYSNGKGRKVPGCSGKDGHSKLSGAMQMADPTGAGRATHGTGKFGRHSGHLWHSDSRNWDEGKIKEMAAWQEAQSQRSGAGDWWAVEPPVGRVVDGTSTILDVSLSGGIDETVSILRCCACSQEVERWFREQGDNIQQPQILQFEMLRRCCSCQKRLLKKLCLQKGAESLSNYRAIKVRTLWSGKGKIDAQSQKWRQAQQRQGECGNFVLALPCKSGYESGSMGKETNTKIELHRLRKEDSLEQTPENNNLRRKMFKNSGTNKRKQKMACSRISRLRCLGNGVVPQQALPAWEKIIQMSEAQK